MTSCPAEISTFDPAIRQLDNRALRLKKFGRSMLVIGGAALAISAVFHLIGSTDPFPKTLGGLHIPPSLLDKLEAASQAAQQASGVLGRKGSGVAEQIALSSQQMTKDLSSIAFALVGISFVAAFFSFIAGSNQFKRVLMVAIGAFGIALSSMFADYFTSAMPVKGQPQSRSSLQATLEREITKGDWQDIGHLMSIGGNEAQLKYLRAQASLRAGDTKGVQTLLDEIGVRENAAVDRTIDANPETLYVLETAAYGAARSADAHNYHLGKITDQKYWTNGADTMMSNAGITLGIGLTFYGFGGWIKRRASRLSVFLNRLNAGQENHPALADQRKTDDILAWEGLATMANPDIEHDNLPAKA